jgi:hypothetical protein
MRGFTLGLVPSVFHVEHIIAEVRICFYEGMFHVERSPELSHEEMFTLGLVPSLVPRGTLGSDQENHFQPLSTGSHS